MKKALLLIALFPLLTFCSRGEFAGKETEEDTIEMESPSSIICNAQVIFTSNYETIKGLMVGTSKPYDYVPTVLSFKVLKSNDTFVLKNIRSYVSNAIVDTLEITPGNSTDLYQGYTVKLLDKHCNNKFTIKANYEQIGPMYRRVKVESSHPEISEVTGPDNNKMNIGEDYQISASLKGNSGYGFSHWTRDGVVIPDAGLDYTLSLTEKEYDAGDTTSIRFMAHFSKDATARTVFEWTQGGMVTGWQDLGLNIPVGTVFTLTATPEAGYKFVRWMKSSATGPVIVGTEPVYSGRVTSKEGTTYTAIFESTAQVTHVTFNNQVDDSYYLSQSFIEYTDPSGRPRTLFPSSITSFFEIKKGTSVSVNVDIRKQGEYINCFLSSSDGQYFDLSGNNQIITAKAINLEPDLDNSATITLQAGE